MSGLSSFLGRSKDLLYGSAGVKEEVQDPVFEGIVSPWGMGYGHGKWTMEGLTEIRNVLFWVALFAVLLLCAAVSNPSETSFRSHLTELSFRRHLADIRSSDDGSTPDDDVHLPSTVPASPDRVTTGTDTPPIAPFRFANHVAISLRTPTLLYKTFFFFSLAFTSPLGPPSFLSDPTPLSKGKQPTVPRDRVVVYFGCLGHWSVVGLIPKQAEWIWKLAVEGGREKGRKKGLASERPGILEMRALAGKEDTPAASNKTLLTLGQSLAPAKFMLRDSTSHLNDIALQTTHLQPPSLHVPSLPNDPQRTSLVPPTPPITLTEPSETPASPLLTTLKADLVTAQTALTELKNQLLLHEESVSDAHSSLQITLEELRTKRKEDDTERQELKTKTKSLEDQKRQAESSRREADKKLKAVEAVRDALEAKISAAVNEMEDLRGNMEVSERNVRIIQEEGAKYVVETGEAAEGKRKELVILEGEVEGLESNSDNLGKQVREAEERLRVAVESGEAQRKLAPEEEMMLMAAAYEAAAQEGYLYGNPQTQQQATWANQAAAYMAEAGMPYLDQNYTARPNHSTSFGHLAKQTISASAREENRRLADVSGFEDFGPGVAGRRGIVTPPISETESDIYGTDPGSPNGGISTSFSANLLPMGLFKSLEGDVTPINGDEDEEVLPHFLQEALRFEPSPPAHLEDHDSGSESPEEAEQEVDLWRSPPSHPPTLENGSKRLSGFLSSSSTTPPGVPGNLSLNINTPPSLPGLPALQGARRWFSGTSSAENINSFTFMHPTSTNSNDSLHLNPYSSMSPFAPMPHEQAALQKKQNRWGTISSKYPWASGRSATQQESSEPVSSDMDSSSSWLSSRLSSSTSNGTGIGIGIGNAPGLGDVSVAGVEAEGEGEDKKKPFRFFSLRKAQPLG